MEHFIFGLIIVCALLACEKSKLQEEVKALKFECVPKITEGTRK